MNKRKNEVAMGMCCEPEQAKDSRYSGGRDYSLGGMRQNGRVVRDDDNSFSTKQKADTGLTMRKPL